MKSLVKASKVVVVGVVLLWLVPLLFTMRVEPNEIGVRQSAASGVLDEDLGPGWHLRIPGIHKLIVLPSSYFMLDYTSDNVGPQKPLVIRTKDNNTVELDVSVPVRIKPGEANELVATGNHVPDPDGRFRYQRLAEETATSVLREELATLDSVGFYSTDRRLGATETALKMLNKQLAPMHLEAQEVLVREVRFRPEYEKQLQQIQLNEQNKLLDAASQKLAGVQQTLDNYRAGHERAGLAAHAGLGQAHRGARARVPGGPARRRGCDAGRGAREAEDDGARGRRGAARAGRREVRPRRGLGHRWLSVRHQEHPGRDARVQEPDHRRGRCARGAVRGRGRCDGRQGPGRVRGQAERAARLARRARPTSPTRPRRTSSSPRC